MIVPPINIEIFSILYQIETGLRELIIDSLSNVYGARWYKTCLPPDVLQKYKAAVKYEKTTNWTCHVPHHPIYYVDFPDLRKIVEQSNNWNTVFRENTAHKDLLMITLREIEPARNKIAHNRKATETDRCIVESAFEKIKAIFGSEEFAEFSSRCTLASSVPDQLLRLREEILCAVERMLDFQELSTPIWDSIREAWWFDEDFLHLDLGRIRDLYSLVTEYRELPRFRGSGHQIASWVEKKPLKKSCELAVATLINA